MIIHLSSGYVNEVNVVSDVMSVIVIYSWVMSIHMYVLWQVLSITIRVIISQINYLRLRILTIIEHFRNLIRRIKTKDGSLYNRSLPGKRSQPPMRLNLRVKNGICPVVLTLGCQ